MAKEKRYWDSDCFLAWLNAETDKADKCKGVLQAAEKGKIEIVISAFTIVEVLYLKGHPKITKEKSEKISRFFDNDYITPIVLDRDLAEMARNLVWEHNKLKPKDAIHVASALKAKITRLDTFDEELIQLSGQIGDPALIIGYPDIPSQENLPYEES